MKKDTIKNKLDILESKLNAILLQAAPPAPAPYTLHNWLAEWFAVYKPPTLSKKWRDNIRRAIDRIKATIPDRLLNEYTPAELLQAVYAVPVGYTRQIVFDTLKAAYEQAARLGYVLFNPLDRVDGVKHQRQRGKALTLDEQARFLQALNGDRHKPLYLFYLLSGCRCSEALALKWSDIDENAQKIHIHGTKTPRADRYIPLFPQICAILADLPRDCVNIFPYTHNAVKSHFQRLKRKYGFMFRLHDLRHTFATRCIESGISLFTLSKWLGHTSIATTATIYAHLLTEFERQEIERFNPKI